MRWGLSNPAYASFDAAGNHTLITASAGQALFESVFIVARGGNYGWNIREGTHCFNSSDNTKPPAGPCPVSGARGEHLTGRSSKPVMTWAIRSWADTFTAAPQCPDLTGIIFSGSGVPVLHAGMAACWFHPRPKVMRSACTPLTQETSHPGTTACGQPGVQGPRQSQREGECLCEGIC